MPAAAQPERKQFPLDSQEHQQMGKRTKELEKLLTEIADVVLTKTGVDGAKTVSEVTISMPAGNSPLRIGVTAKSAGGKAHLDDPIYGCYMDPPGVCMPGRCP